MNVSCDQFRAALSINYLAGNGPQAANTPELRGHFDSCPHCQEVISRASQDQKYAEELVKKYGGNVKLTCDQFRQQVAFNFLMGTDPRSAPKEVAEHFRDCPQCREAVVCKTPETLLNFLKEQTLNSFKESFGDCVIVEIEIPEEQPVN